METEGEYCNMEKPELLNYIKLLESRCAESEKKVNLLEKRMSDSKSVKYLKSLEQRCVDSEEKAHFLIKSKVGYEKLIHHLESNQSKLKSETTECKQIAKVLKSQNEILWKQNGDIETENRLFKLELESREEYKNINDILKFVIESRHDEENSK